MAVLIFVDDFLNRDDYAWLCDACDLSGFHFLGAGLSARLCSILNISLLGWTLYRVLAGVVRWI